MKNRVKRRGGTQPSPGLCILGAGGSLFVQVRIMLRLLLLSAVYVVSLATFAFAYSGLPL